MRPGRRVALEIHALHELARFIEKYPQHGLEPRRRDDSGAKFPEARKKPWIETLHVENRIQHMARLGVNMPLRIGGGLPVDEGVGGFDFPLESRMGAVALARIDQSANDDASIDVGMHRNHQHARRAHWKLSWQSAFPSLF